MPIELESDIDPIRSLALQDMSYSRLTTYLDCAAKYFYSYVVKEEQDYGPAALLGNVIHKALEVTLEDGQKINVHELIRNFKAATLELDVTSRLTPEHLSNGEAMLIEFVDTNADEQTVYAKELPFSFVLGRARFNGFIDYVAVYDDYVHICDYKSGAREVAAKDIPNNLQLGIYSMYMKYLFPDKDIYAELYYLKSGRRKGHRFTSDDLSVIETNLSDLIDEVLDTDNFKETQDESKCRWCSYAKEGICPTGQRRIHRRG